MVGCVYMFVEFNSVTCEEVCLAFERIISVKSSLYIYIYIFVVAQPTSRRPSRVQSIYDAILSVAL